MNKQTYTPWGPAHHSTPYANGGIVFHSTSSHGGFYLDPTHNGIFQEKLPTFKPFGGRTFWYEEDCDALAVVVVFSDLFEPVTVANAIRGVRSFARAGSSYPEHWKDVAAFVDQSPMLLEIEKREKSRTSDMWERTAMSSGGRLRPEYRDCWIVNFRRDGDCRVLMVPGYPDKQYYTDAELASFEAYETAKHELTRV